MPDPIEITDPDFIHSVAERRSRLMTLHRVPITPRNYEVWFNYVRGTSPALRRTIDVQIANDPSDREDWPRQHRWLAERLNNLHRAFFERVSALSAADNGASDAIDICDAA